MSPMTFSIEPPTFLLADELSDEGGSWVLDVLQAGLPRSNAFSFVGKRSAVRSSMTSEAICRHDETVSCDNRHMTTESSCADVHLVNENFQSVVLRGVPEDVIRLKYLIEREFVSNEALHGQLLLRN